jgi:hypothetical protein
MILLILLLLLTDDEVIKKLESLESKMDNLSKTYDLLYDTNMSCIGLVSFGILGLICYIVYKKCIMKEEIQLPEGIV